MTATIDPGETASLVVSGNALHFGAVPAACGAATTTNTDSIAVNGSAGTDETLVLDHRGGLFAPGFSSESNIREIEITTSLGDTTDTVVVFATEGDDFMAAGQFGMALNTDGDVDVIFSPSVLKLEMNMLGGHDYFNGRGQGGAGLHFLGPFKIWGGEGNDSLLRGSSEPDFIDGGPGDDTIQAQELNDVVIAGPGNDTIAGGDGNDSMDGGPGLDSFSGSGGDDTMLAQDDEADTLLNGGPGIDTAYYDTGVDANPVATEIKIGDGPPPPPPPPPPGSCTYDAAAKAVSATLGPGTSATLTVSGNEIWFGATPAVCGAATTANTDSIAISGNTSTVETLVLDLSGGAFAPGATLESTGSSEIEITTTLGDITDVLVVQGGAAADTIRMGQTGMGLNGDTDRDVTFAPMPAQVEIFGNGGVNTLSSKGGSGTGGAFLGRAVIHAGDSGDLLQGGSGNDELIGGLGNDRLEGALGNDTMTGGGGSDDFVGGDGDDTMHANDDLADVKIAGGPGVDTAYYDLGIDPNPTATENKIAA